MRKYLIRSIVPAALAFILAGQAVAAPPVEERPGCRGALDGQQVDICRFQMERGQFDPSGSHWMPSGQFGEAVSEQLHEYTDAVILRAPTPIGTSERAGDVTYDVQFNAGIDPAYAEQRRIEPGSAASAKVIVWIGDDQGQHRRQLLERTVTLGGDEVGPVRISASGQDVGFEPNQLYVEFHGAEKVNGVGNKYLVPMRVESVRVGIRPTAAP